MNKRMIIGTSLMTLLALGLLLAGCNGGGDDKAAKTEVPAAEVTPAETPAETAAEAPAEAVVMHDCAGGCGMTAMPEDQMTAVDGQWYCAGCAEKAKAASEAAAHGEG